MHAALLRSISLTALALALAGPSAADPMVYPDNRPGDVVDDYHGTPVPDPYRWLEDDQAPEVQAWIEAQNALTRGALDAIPGRAEVREQFDALYSYPINFTVTQTANYLFWNRRVEGQDQPTVHFARWDQLGAGGLPVEAPLLIDLNALSPDGTIAMDWMHPSYDGELVAYGLSEKGSEDSTLYVRRTATGEDLPDQIPHTRACAVAWLADNSGFYYTRYPQAGEVPDEELQFHRKVYFHRLGTDWSADPYVFGAGVAKETWHSVGVSSDQSTLIVYRSLDWAKNDLFIRPLDAPLDAPFTTIADGLDGQTSVDVVDGETLIIQSTVGSPRGRVLRAPLESPELQTEIIAEGEGVIEAVDVVQGRLVVRTLENVAAYLRVYDLYGGLEREVELPTLGTIDASSAHASRDTLYFGFTSFAYPYTILELDPASGTTERVDGLSIPLDWERYVSRQEWAVSADGTRIPMFVVMRADLEASGTLPTILYGYGGFNSSQTPSFARSRVPWLEAGGVFVITNLRGGGEFGKEWHLGGRGAVKQHTYDDFYACAQRLFELGLTSPRYLAAMGGSNGGLLVGAAITQRPELFQAAVCQVPLLDMVRFDQFLLGKLWVPEYGSATDPEQFGWIWAYSPYHHVLEGVEYPAILLTAGAEDSRVEPLHARKMAAMLQDRSGGEGPVLLRIETKAGHGQGKPLSQSFEDWADEYSFLAAELGLAWPPSAGVERYRGEGQNVEDAAGV